MKIIRSILFLSLLSGWAAFPLFLTGCNETSSPNDSTSNGVILKSTTLYADEKTLLTMDEESSKGGDAGIRALERLGREGKIWTADKDIPVKILKSGGPMEAVFVDAGKAAKPNRFWVMKFAVVAENHPAIGQGAKRSQAASKFEYVLDGDERIEIDDAYVDNLVDLVVAIYEGKISEKNAKRCIVLGPAITRSSYGFQNVAGDRLIYEGTPTHRERFQFALMRDSDFEKKDRGENLILYGDLVFVGREDFTTRRGLVISIPVFKAINLDY